MDLTPTYIKMCEKAEEIQKLRKGKWRIDDFTISPDTGRIYIGIDYALKDCSKPPNTDFMIWLPRQDQLQEMIFGTLDYRNSIGNFFLRAYDTEETEYYLTSGSHEQAWLKMVIKEKYNKTWDSEKEEWV